MVTMVVFDKPEHCVNCRKNPVRDGENVVLCQQCVNALPTGQAEMLEREYLLAMTLLKWEKSK